MGKRKTRTTARLMAAQDPVADEVASYGSNADEVLESGRRLVRKAQALLNLPPTASSMEKYEQLETEIVNTVMGIADQSYVDDRHADAIENLSGDLSAFLANLEQKFGAPAAPPTIPAPPAYQQPPARPQYVFPMFEGGRAEFHSWMQRLARYIDLENPPQDIVYRFLRNDLLPKLPGVYRGQLEDAATVADFLEALRRIYGSAEAAMERAHKKIEALPNFKSNRPEHVLDFFNSLREVTADLKFLDATFPNEVQLPSESILCRCNIEKIRKKLNRETDDKLIELMMGAGEFCAPKQTYELLLSLEEITTKKARLTLASDPPSSHNNNEGHKEKPKHSKGQAKSVKAARQSQPSPQRGQPHRPDPTAGKKTIQRFCYTCEADDHGTFSKLCPLARGRDPGILEKLAARSVCLRCVRPQKFCQEKPCNGGYRPKDGSFVETDCKVCKFKGKPINRQLCSHAESEQPPAQM